MTQLYIGQTRARKTIAQLAALGIGECTQRGENAARRFPWVLDNGAWADFVAAKKAGTLEAYMAGDGFDGQAWIDTFPRHAGTPAPDFIVLPDIVGGGRRSLDFSIDWWTRTSDLAIETWGTRPPFYLAVQDGMTAADIDEALHLADGIFVGGTTDWKLLAAPGIIQRAHGGGTWVDSCPPLDLPKPVHVGRVGTGRRIVWSRFAGADSIDSCLPLMETSKMEIATFAAGEELEAAARRFPVGRTMAADAWAGVVRRQALRGELDQETVRHLVEAGGR